MEINLVSPYRSIQSLETVELPGFAVLIGRNGAGKTQLLEGLTEGHLEMAGIARFDIEHFDMHSFFSPNAGESGRQVNQFAHATAAALFGSYAGDPPLNETAREIFDQAIGAYASDQGAQAAHRLVEDLRTEIRSMPDFTVFGDRGSAFPAVDELKRRVFEPLYEQFNNDLGITSFRMSPDGLDDNPTKLVSAAMKQSNKLLHELDRSDVLRAGNFEGPMLANLISEIFATYKIDQYVQTHRRIETASVSFSELVDDYRSSNPAPWELIREVLAEMRELTGGGDVFNFDFSDPEDHMLDIDNHASFKFKTEMTNLTTGDRYELESLSSGERILMALCLVRFNQYLGRRRPKLLLLDEVDAVLHPSMLKALVTMLKRLFVDAGTKVVMTSHSPMTVAVLEEHEIFRVSRNGGDAKVAGTTKAAAIDELSEGIATVDMGLRIAAFEKAKVAIISEGANTKHLKKWASISFSDDVRVFEGLEDRTSCGELLSYGQLLGRMDLRTHFVIVWDCDARRNVERLRTRLPPNARVTPYAFHRRADNRYADTGIENNYDDEFLNSFVNSQIGNIDDLKEFRFTSTNKSKFADYVLEHGKEADFTRFGELGRLVSEILESYS